MGLIAYLAGADSTRISSDIGEIIRPFGITVKKNFLEPTCGRPLCRDFCKRFQCMRLEWIWELHVQGK